MDLSAPDGPLDHRSWRWFHARLSGLLASDTRLGRAFAPKPDAEQHRPSTYD